MKSSKLIRLASFGVLACASATAHAQVRATILPLPTPKLPSSATRQRLRAAILQVATSNDPKVQDIRGDLALPLAELGDWDGAFQLLRGSRYASQKSDELWQWRSYQLAEAGKWGQVAAAAAHMQPSQAHTDALLFTARCMVDRNIMLGSPQDTSQQLECILTAARAGDIVAAQKAFDKIYREMDTSSSTADVITFEAQAGLFSDAAAQLNLGNPYSVDSLVVDARTPADLKTMDNIVARLPTDLRPHFVLHLALVSPWCGDQAGGVARFYKGIKLAAASKESDDSLTSLSSNKILVYEAAHTLKLASEEARSKDDLRAYVSRLGREDAPIPLAGIDIMPALVDLDGAYRVPGLSSRMPTAAQLDGLASQVTSAQPSYLQIHALQALASCYLQRRQTNKVLELAEAMSKATKALSAAANARPDLRSFAHLASGASWENTIMWFQRAGDQITASNLASELARSATVAEKPYIAKSLLCLGFADLAQSLFDPREEAPNYGSARDAKNADNAWNTEYFWRDYVAAEANGAVPEAPFRWYARLPPDVYGRSNVLGAWVKSLYPQPRQQVRAPAAWFWATGDSQTWY